MLRVWIALGLVLLILVIVGLWLVARARRSRSKQPPPRPGWSSRQTPRGPDDDPDFLRSIGNEPDDKGPA